MTITEESRYQLFKKLEGTLGSDDSNTLMEHLPPVGWADVATKADLATLRTDLVQLEQRIDLRFESLGHKLRAALSEGLHRQFVQIVASVATLLTIMLTLAVTANQLLGA